MAQRGRPRKTDTRPNASSDDRTSYRCTRCGRDYKVQRGNFPYSQSSLNDGNNHYSPICYTCVDELFEHYSKVLGSETAALRRICSKLDMYFSLDVYAMTEKSSMDASRIGMYASKLGLKSFKGKTFDTTMDEERDGNEDELRFTVPKKVRKFFGEGFDNSDYEFLNDQYNDWVSRYECKTKAQEDLFKDLSFAQLNVVKAQRNGDIKKVNECIAAKQTIMKSQAITPLQRNDSALGDQNTFGTLIKKWEDERPIPEPAEEWKDVDGIVHYITVYFLGHICRMFGLQNRYSRLYEQEMSKYRVERPEQEEDAEVTFETTFKDMMVNE